MTTATEIQERPDVKEATTGPEMFHYVDKTKSLESAVFGTYVEALCGLQVPGHQGRQARLADLPGVQGDLRQRRPVVRPGSELISAGTDAAVATRLGAPAGDTWAAAPASPLTSSASRCSPPL